ncbi:hypothetical protein FGB62_96g00 [Gracilaria domingensis]|nr:hypothetical protein FGB62_96g00 [Gracilaria domingensis]
MGDGSGCRMVGRGVIVGGKERYRQALDYAHGDLPVTSYDLKVISLYYIPKALILKGDVEVQFECRSEYHRRMTRDSQRARQSCWAAGVFEEEEAIQGEVSSSIRVFYGCIDEIWRAKVSYRRPGEQLRYTRLSNMVRVDWIYGLRMDQVSGVPSVALSTRSRRGSLRDKKRSVENVKSISRSIAFFDHGGRRHFPDPLMSELIGASHLGGLIRWPVTNVATECKTELTVL